MENKKKKIRLMSWPDVGYDGDPIKAGRISGNTQMKKRRMRMKMVSPKKFMMERVLTMTISWACPCWNLTKKRKIGSVRTEIRETKKIQETQATTTESMWKTDLDEFVTKL